MKKIVLTLGIETSCDETSFAVVKNGRQILSNVIVSSLKQQRPYGGIVPEIASRAHVEVVLPVLKAALKKARVSLKSIDLIAVTQGPGLMGSLLVGLSAAKSLSLALEKPIIGVDHVVAHLYSGLLSEPKLRFPFLGLVVSGGHTMLIRMESAARYKILGSTIDDAAGEAFDKVAKILGLGYPGGPEVEKLSRGQDTSRFYFTRPFLSNASHNFSFSGIKTAVFYKVEGLRKGGKISLAVTKALAAGFQEAVCETLVKKTLRAAEAENLGSIVVGGGVSANARLRAMFLGAARDKKIRVIFPEMKLCQDNAAMIAACGAALYKAGRRDTLQLSSYSDFHGNQARRV